MLTFVVCFSHITNKNRWIENIYEFEHGIDIGLTYLLPIATAGLSTSLLAQKISETTLLSLHY